MKATRNDILLARRRGSAAKGASEGCSVSVVSVVLLIARLVRVGSTNVGGFNVRGVKSAAARGEEAVRLKAENTI